MQCGPSFKRGKRGAGVEDVRKGGGECGVTTVAVAVAAPAPRFDISARLHEQLADLQMAFGGGAYERSVLAATHELIPKSAN